MTPPRLHVICGGGTGSQLLKRLHELGYRLSAGPLASADDDARTAALVGADVALSAPGAEPGTDPLARARELLLGADAAVLTAFAVGRGNLSSLSLALEFPVDRPLYLVLGGDFARRDYTGGNASELYARLRARAATEPRAIAELLPLLVARFPPI